MDLEIRQVSSASNIWSKALFAAQYPSLHFQYLLWSILINTLFRTKEIAINEIAYTERQLSERAF